MSRIWGPQEILSVSGALLRVTQFRKRDAVPRNITPKRVRSSRAAATPQKIPGNMMFSFHEIGFLYNMIPFATHHYSRCKTNNSDELVRRKKSYQVMNCHRKSIQNCIDGTIARESRNNQAWKEISATEVGNSRILSVAGKRLMGIPN